MDMAVCFFVDDEGKHRGFDGVMDKVFVKCKQICNNNSGSARLKSAAGHNMILP